MKVGSRGPSAYKPRQVRKEATVSGIARMPWGCLTGVYRVWMVCAAEPIEGARLEPGLYIRRRYVETGDFGCGAGL